MKKGEKMSEEQSAAIKKGRQEYWDKMRALKAAAAAAPAPSMKVEPEGNVPEPVVATANGHGNLLDIGDPLKWQMKIRMHLETLTSDAAEAWLDGFRLDYQMAGVVVRDQVYRRTTARCYICNKPFTEGRPAGEAFYFDADRVCIKVYCCHQAEYAELLKKCQEKESQVAVALEKAEKAGRQAMMDARSASRKEMRA